MTDSQFYGWSRKDAAVLNDATIPRRAETWLAKRLKEKQAE
jgi:hypothetical protein